MNKRKLFPVLFAALMLAVFAAPANATSLDENMCVNTIGGVWLSDTCLVNADYNISTDQIIDINSGITLLIGNITLGNVGTINVNYGGNLTNMGSIYNGGTVFIACGGTFAGHYPEVGFLTIEFGCSKSTPVTDIQNLIDTVENLNLQHGIENSLVAKLNAAILEIQDNNNAEAINSLQAFINEVNAQRGKKITGSEADILIAAAQAIISQLTGP